MKSKTQYDSELEKKWQDFWEKEEVYKYDETKEEVFSIDTPPPTVSGNLHMGHIFSYTQTDFVARYQRMKGKTVFYPMGFDDNGLPTERLVEKVKGVRSTQMSRSEFIKLCQETIPEYEEQFRKLFKSIALSVDWNHEYQTVSKHTQNISQLSFIDLYEKGKIIRHKAPVFWDPVDQTAIAQAEIEDKEKQGVMIDIKFDIKNEKNSIVISTTRPELISACVAIFVHPNDARYKNFIGKEAITPIFNKNVSIIADSDVLQEKGTGAVMCCTFGDIQDITWWLKYKLAIIDSITKDGKMIDPYFENMNVKHARAKIIDDLGNAIINQKQVTQQVKCAERSGAPLEILSTEQWYIKVMDAKKDILDKAYQCKWYPEHMKVRLENWVNGLNQEWCISRQRHFGVPFPVWYSKKPGEEEKIIVADASQLPVDPLVDLPVGYKREEVIAEDGVMDTWATSALTPQISSGGISEKYSLDSEKHKKLFPFDLRPQAHEIIRVWAFGTIVKSLYHENSIPWKNLMISGWCLANDKSKMSKSKGNVIDPVKLIEEYGADVVRYWASTSKLGNDIVLSDDAFKIGKKLILKLINATNFCLMHLGNLKNNNEELITETLDKWVLLELKNTIAKVEEEFSNFEYCGARMAVEEFFWKVFCDNYLELVKDRIYKKHTTHEGQSGIITLYLVLKNILKLFAPFIPHITEELYQNLCEAGNNEVISIHKIGNWPDIVLTNYNNALQAEGNVILELLDVLRKFKSENEMSVSAELDTVTLYMKEKNITESALSDLVAAAKIKNLLIEKMQNDTITQFVLKSGEIKLSILKNISEI